VRIAIAILLLSSFPLSFGQQPTSSASSSKQAPLELHREPSGSNVHPGSSGTPSILQQYDFGAQVRTLTEGVGPVSPESIKPEFGSQNPVRVKPAAPPQFRRISG
jgi:hypothetical protein